MRLIRRLEMWMRVLLLTALGTSLTACANSSFVTLDAAGKAFPRAVYAVKGKTSYDQLWVDKTIEAEVVGFGFPRPKARPASLDNPNTPKPRVVVVKPKPAPHGGLIHMPPARPDQHEVVTVVPHKPTYRERIKAQIQRLEERIKHLRHRSNTQ